MCFMHSSFKSDVLVFPYQSIVLQYRKHTTLQLKWKRHGLNYRIRQRIRSQIVSSVEFLIQKCSILDKQ